MNCIQLKGCELLAITVLAVLVPSVPTLQLIISIGVQPIRRVPTSPYVLAVVACENLASSTGRLNKHFGQQGHTVQATLFKFRSNHFQLSTPSQKRFNGALALL